MRKCNYLNKYTILAICLLLLSPIIVSASNLPVIFYTDIIAGPKSGGENNLGCYLTINGKNFGNTRGSSTVTIGGGEVAVYKVWSDSEISVQIGPEVSSGTITVTTSDGYASAPEQFTVRSGDFYYVSTSGNDSTGSKNDITKPYRTANYVMTLSEFDAGDFMVVRGGTYDLSSGREGLYSGRWLNVGPNNKSGTSLTNAITIYGYPGEDANIDWGTITSSGNSGIRCVWNTKYYVFSNLNFEMRNSGGTAIYLGFYSDASQACNYARIVNIKVRGGMAGATYGVNAVSLQRVDHLKMYGFDIGNQSSQASPDLESHIIYLSHFYTNADIGWIHVHDNSYGRAALQVAGDGAQSNNNINVRIHDSVFENLPEAAILCNIGSREIYIYNNIINNVCTKHPPGFSPLALRGAAANVGDYYIYNNTIYTDATDYYPGGIIQMGYLYEYPSSVKLYNNIIYAKSSTTNYFQINNSNFSVNRISADYNCWFGSSDNPPTWAGSHKVITDPKFVNAAAGVFTLQDDSPCKNFGTLEVNNILRTDIYGTNRGADSYFDIGAVETTNEIGGSAGSPPYIDNRSPDMGSTGFFKDQDIILHVKDNEEGVDLSTIVIKINGQSVQPSITGNKNDYIVTYKPQSSFSPGSVSVSVTANDLAYPPHTLNEQYSYKVGELRIVN